MLEGFIVGTVVGEVVCVGSGDGDGVGNGGERGDEGESVHLQIELPDGERHQQQVPSDY